MNIFYNRRNNSVQLQKKPNFQNNPKTRLTALFLCLSMFMYFFPALAQAADTEEKLSAIVEFKSIKLHYADSSGLPETNPISDGAMIEKDKQLVLRYTYDITEEQCKQITADTKYYLEVSPHLLLPDLSKGSPLTVKNEDGSEEKFGTIYASNNKAWITFLPGENGSSTVLSEYSKLENADFYLNCTRAKEVPPGELPIDGKTNLYAMKFENNDQLKFGYAENEPVTAKAKINKGGKLEDKTITWTIKYTPWQNPSPGDPVKSDTPFELRDTIDTSLHKYISDSVKIDGSPTTVYTSRSDIPKNAETYVLEETSENGSTILTFGGAKFNAGEATQANPAKSLSITYQTSVNDNLLLPGSGGDKKVTNAADLFASDGNNFNKLNITSSSTVTIPQSKWLTKTGKTTRHTDGTGSTTDWEVIFQPNGFNFTDEQKLTLYDQLPAGSTLVENSVKVNNESKPAKTDNQIFTVSSITTNNQPVTITYQTHVPEDMYDNGTSLGNNTAWFTFQYNNNKYETPKAITPIGSGDGSGTPGTATLVKTNTGYNAAKRTIDWQVKINPHKSKLKSGTFTDDLSKIGPQCNINGHTGGLDVVGGKDGIKVLIDDKPDSTDSVTLEYENQKITVTVKDIEAKTITLAYTTKVCDPCIFANNTANKQFKNTISTNDMIIGNNSDKRSAGADSTANVGATVLTKKAPVYDYSTGIMKWTVEVNAAGLSMAYVVLTDTLPDGLTYLENSLKTEPQISGASASAEGQDLTINLNAVTKKTIVTFDTKINPEILGFGGDKPVIVNNTIRMKGRADNVEFEEISHNVQQSFSNHGLTKSSSVDNQQELIKYDVLINPYHLALPENPSIVDTLDKRLQLDTDTLRFYKAKLNGTSTTNKDQRPNYEKVGDGQPLKISDFDPDANSFTVQLPISADDTGAYVLTYTADIIQREAGGYGNSVHFEGGTVMLGGGKNNSASVGGGGGGGGGGVAARKAAISIIKTDSETQKPLSGVSFMLYQWDSGLNERGLPFAQGTTDAQGKLSFKVKPQTLYELTETESIPGYGNAFNIEDLPDGAEKTDGGLLIESGDAKTELTLALTNKANTTDIIFRLVNNCGIPMAGAKVKMFKTYPGETENPDPDMEVTVSEDGTVKFPGIRRNAKYYIQRPDGEIMTIEVPVQVDAEPKVELPDGTSETLTKDYEIENDISEEEQWALTVYKVISGGAIPLSGATIGLYADAACELLIKTAESDQNGSIKFEGLIKGQNYWLREITAPFNYKLNPDIYKADENDPTVTIENTPSNPDEPDEPNTPDNPDEPNKPNTPDNPDEPDEPNNPDNPGEPDEPSVPDKPNEPDEPNTPDKPSEPDEPSVPDKPNEPDEPNNPDKPSEPDEPNTPDNPDEPDEPNTSDNPDKPDEPNTPDNPDKPDEPNTPDKPSEPDEPNVPNEPDKTDISGELDTSDEAGSENVAALINTDNVPQTGDYTVLLIAVTLLSGVLLAIMTLYLFSRSKKREKK